LSLTDVLDFGTDDDNTATFAFGGTQSIQLFISGDADGGDDDAVDFDNFSNADGNDGFRDTGQDITVGSITYNIFGFYDGSGTNVSTNYDLTSFVAIQNNMDVS
jgi:hypothetical protein